VPSFDEEEAPTRMTLPAEVAHVVRAGTKHRGPGQDC